MLRPGPLFSTMALCAVIGACGGSSVTPLPVPTGYDGQWSGTTSQGKPITFTVSTDQKVTAIRVEYSFNGCSGTHAFSNLSLDIGTPPNPAAPTLGPGFGYGTAGPDGSNYTQIYGTFNSTTTAIGTVVFAEYPGCGSTAGIWNATRR
jgi:hypothetical protein